MTDWRTLLRLGVFPETLIDASTRKSFNAQTCERSRHTINSYFFSQNYGIFNKSSLRRQVDASEDSNTASMIEMATAVSVFVVEFEALKLGDSYQETPD